MKRSNDKVSEAGLTVVASPSPYNLLYYAHASIIGGEFKWHHYSVRCRITVFGVLTFMGRVFLRGQLRTTASRGLAVTAEFIIR